jgi:hypothetical protein
VDAIALAVQDRAVVNHHADAADLDPFRLAIMHIAIVDDIAVAVVVHLGVEIPLLERSVVRLIAVYL